MKQLRRPALAFAMLAWLAAPGAAQVPSAQAPMGRDAALADLDRGTAAFRAGDMTGAEHAWSHAAELAHEASAPDIVAQALVRRGEMYRTQGYLRNAFVDLKAALAGADASGNTQLIAAASGALGSLELAARQTGSAEMLLLKSRRLARQSADQQTLAASDNDLGNLYVQTGRPAEAAAAYAEAEASAEAAGNITLAAAADVNRARLALQLDNVGAAARLLSQAIDRLQQIAPSYAGAMALVSAGTAVLDYQISASSRGALPVSLARRALLAAAAAGEALHDAAILSLARGSLGRLAALTGDPAAASQLTDQAVFAAQEATAPQLSYRWDWQRARLARRRGEASDALADYRRAIAALQSVRQDIPVEYRNGQSSYRVTFGPLYREYADLLLRRAPIDPADRAALLREARDTIEDLKESELQDYFRDSCIADFEARRQSVDTVAPGAAVLYPIALPDRLELLVSFGPHIRQFTIPLREAALRQEAQQFRELLEKRTTNQYLVPAERLYDQLIGPIAPLLAQQQINTLVIVPDDIFRIIPFAALYDGRQFLVERYATAVAPSLHLIAPEPLSAAPRLALVIGLSKSVEGYAELPNVEHEIAAVHRLEGGEELADAAFTKAEFAGQLRTEPYNIVHLASHAQFNADPKRTFLLAYDGKLTMDALESDIKYGEHRNDPLELLVLSACETAAGDDRSALGLAGVALKAGARSALASLWYVNDRAAGTLVVDFYRALQSGTLSKAQALQQAQRQLIASGQFSHPAYWAPFLMIGNWL
jgi:CHAT domain-containing protein